MFIGHGANFEIGDAALRALPGVRLPGLGLDRASVLAADKGPVTVLSRQSWGTGAPS
jgi:hypothetical protein